MILAEQTNPALAARTIDEPLPEWYGAWTAAEKLMYLWEHRLLATEFPAFPDFESRGLPVSTHDLAESFDYVSDEMPPGHRRTLHLRGMVARATWEAEAHVPYTGLFLGVEHAIVRLSVATAPRWPAGFVPGLGVKLLVDHGPSANLHVMHSVDGQGEDHDVFARPFSNKLPPARGWLTWLGAQLFRRVKSDPFYLPVDHLARRTQDGHGVDRPRWPYQLHFLPGPAVRGQRDPLARHDFRADLAKTPEGSVLYEVLASEQPDSAPAPVARLVTRSRFISSWWGDERLFLQHQR